MKLKKFLRFSWFLEEFENVKSERIENVKFTNMQIENVKFLNINFNIQIESIKFENTKIERIKSTSINNKNI